MFISPEIKEKIEAKYAEAKEQHATTILLAEELGELMLFINKKPTYLIMECTIGEDRVYVGADSITVTS
jgi:hypothetical protein